MEILSDTVFHGDVSIGTSTNPKALKLYANSSDQSTLTIGQTGETEIIKTDGVVRFGNTLIDGFVYATDYLMFSHTCGGSSIGLDSYNNLKFHQGAGTTRSNTFLFGCREIGKTYYIATQDQIPSMDGFARVQNIPINFDVPADCTRFYLKNANLSTTPYSIQLFKRNENPNGEFGDFVKNVDLGIVCGSMVGQYEVAVVVEKSSSFAMCSSDGYSIRIVY